jgi:hypothetical protein
MLPDCLFYDFASDLHEVALLARAFRHARIMAQMADRYYLLSDGKSLVIWQADPSVFLGIQKLKPQFKLINSYPTRAEALAEIKKRQDPN